MGAKAPPFLSSIPLILQAGKCCLPRSDDPLTPPSLEFWELFEQLWAHSQGMHRVDPWAAPTPMDTLLAFLSQSPVVSASSCCLDKVPLLQELGAEALILVTPPAKPENSLQAARAPGNFIP